MNIFVIIIYIYIYIYIYISVTVVLFIAVKYVIYTFPRRVCPLVPRGSFHCFEKRKYMGESGWCDVTTISPITGL